MDYSPIWGRWYRWCSVSGKRVFTFLAPLLGLTFIDIDPNLQAAIMWIFAAGAVGALVIDRKQHGEMLPMVIGVAALLIIICTLYGF